jgi:uncharacterized protein YdeI (YjbR/CyaY-like superfamily)
MPNPLDQLATFHAHTRAEWRQWLQAHHADSPGIWLITNKKKSGNAHLRYDEAVEEALCFGWIDSLPRKLDDARSMLLFTPRKPKSGWSKLNKDRVEKLLAAGLMTEAGLEKIELAKQNGAWTSLDAVESLTVPPDLQAALDANPTARGYFEKFSKTVRKGILQWIESAKRPQTRQKRIDETVALAAKNEKANQYQPK